MLAPPPIPLALLLAQNRPGSLDIEGEDEEADRQFESVRAASPNPVQLAVIRIVDSRFTPTGMDRKTVRKLPDRGLAAP